MDRRGMSLRKRKGKRKISYFELETMATAREIALHDDV